jgi:hypothetical protein
MLESRHFAMAWYGWMRSGYLATYRVDFMVVMA